MSAPQIVLLPMPAAAAELEPEFAAAFAAKAPQPAHSRANSYPETTDSPKNGQQFPAQFAAAGASRPVPLAAQLAAASGISDSLPTAAGNRAARRGGPIFIHEG